MFYVVVVDVVVFSRSGSCWCRYSRRCGCVCFRNLVVVVGVVVFVVGLVDVAVAVVIVVAVVAFVYHCLV